MATKQSGPKTYSVRVRIREVPHMVVVTDALGNPALTQISGYGPGHPLLDPVTRLGNDADQDSQEYKDAVEDYRRGQKIEVLADDYLRLKNGDAVMDVDDADALPEVDETVLDPLTASIDELAEWIQQEKPTVNEVVQATNGNADIAAKLLEAEGQATDGDPRDGVVRGLTAVISRG